jgi:TolB-like protein
MNRSVRLTVFLCAAALSAAGAHASPAKKAENLARSLSAQILKKKYPGKLSVAVMPFENVEGQPTVLGQMVSEQLAKALVADGPFTVVERNDLAQIFKEWKLATTGAISAKSAGEIGELTGADCLLVGSVRKLGKDEILAEAKLVRTQTGEILQMGSASSDADLELLQLNRPAQASQDSRDDAVPLSRKGDGGCAWYEVPAVVNFGANETRGQARARAIGKARQKALIAASGSDVSAAYSNFADAAFEEASGLIDSVLLLTRYGRIAEEKIVSEDILDGPDCKDCRYRVVEQACVHPPRAGADPGFQASLTLSQAHFREGDEAQVIVTVSRESYVYLFSVDKNWNAVLAFPNDTARNNLVRPEQSFVYPGPQHRQQGIRLVAELPANADFSAESLRLIACKKPLSKIGGDYRKLLEDLDDSGQDWAESAAAFTIRRK